LGNSKLTAAENFRRFIQNAINAYDLASTPPVLNIYDEKIWEADEIELSKARTQLLIFGIDIKHMLSKFLEELTCDHGHKRAERFTIWIIGGYVREFNYVFRREIKWDRKELARRIRRGGYKIGG